MTAKLYRTGFGQRYAMNPEMAWTGQTLGHHQWGVAILLLELFPNCSMATLREALLHDTGEPGAGADVSAPAKAKYPELASAAAAAELNERSEMDVPQDTSFACDHLAIQLCDRLEAYMFAQVRCPHVLERDGWPECRSKIIGLAARLGVEDKVREKLA